MNALHSPLLRLLARVLCVTLACPLPAMAFNENITDISTIPVTLPATTSMQPNILLILDDSGSMARQYTPDFATLESNCFDTGDGDDTLNNTPRVCWAGDPPSMSPDFNAQYYNPEIRYRPAVDYTGLERDSMSCLNTGGRSITGITKNAGTTVFTVSNSFSVGNVISFVGFTGADADFLNNKAFAITARNSSTVTIGAGTLAKDISVPSSPRPCTGGWTSVPSDNVSTSNSDDARINVHDNWGGGGSTVENLNVAGAWPDRVYCTTQADSATDTTKCKINSSYTYPNITYSYGLDTGNDRKFVFGAPYYYRIVVKEYCTDARMNDCKEICEGAATPPSCILSAVSPDNVVAGKSYSVPAPVRFCTNSNRTDCHAKRSTSRTYPKMIGSLNATGTTIPDPAKGRITIATQPDTKQGNVTSIIVTKLDGAVFTLSGTGAGGNLTLSGSDAARDWADDITSRINANTGTHGFSASSSGSTTTTTITAPAGLLVDPHPAESFNGATITVTTNVTANSPASFTVSFSSTTQNSTCSTQSAPNYFSCGNVTSFIVDGVSLLPTSGTHSSGFKCNTSGCNSSNSGTRNTAMRDIVYNNMVLPSGYTKDTSGSTGIEITAPTSIAPLGSNMNGRTWSITRARTSTSPSTPPLTMSGGTTTGDVVNTTYPFADAQSETPPGTIVRSGAATFARTNIVPGQTYNSYAERSDCVSVSNACTYEEEMTNFANWVSYYRTRMQMAKTAIGRAFALAGIGDNFRVGFMTINFATNKYVSVAPFTTGSGNQKDLWFTKLYEAPAGPNTPLRDALSRAGRYFGDRYKGVSNSMGASPINAACQPNYTILTSDGYWNDTGSPAKDLQNNNVGDADGDGVSNTLADVAYYYYNTDLRPIPPVSPSTVGYKNQVPPSGNDDAPHQHMTTFTVGMGVSGSLLFHPNYQTPGNSLDYDSIAGSPANTGRTSAGGIYGSGLWPAPVSGQETTVDDMWHAAVNGRGRFFSAQNPVTLAAGINEVLNAVQKRVGAGSGAGTSNLTPVSGDNFSYTASFATQEWSGDLTAKTIDLITGIVSERVLWSAREQLDTRTFADRNIFTFDETDTNNSLFVAVDGGNRAQNANKLRSFCRPDAPIGTYPTCNDGGLITMTELADHFNPLGGPNAALVQAAGWPALDPRRTAASQTNNTYLFRFLRGERAKEIVVGSATANDLFRTRTHILGDIVSAQPAYVKSSPFAYSAATDPYYTAFQSSTNGSASTRKGTVYMAANDGMLHAFETDPDNIPYYQDAGITPLGDTTDDHFTGTLNTDPVSGEGAERWAYIPQLLFPTLKRLAEENYSTNHRFFADGSPQVGDVCFGHTLSTPCSSAANWRTILVAGLNAGGRGFYALDITDPDNPKGLWELNGGSQALVGGSVKCLTNAEANSGNFSVDCNLGLSFGNPIIAKRPEDGRWVVLLTSGHNNVNPGSGLGYLYVVDAQTGKILRRMSTGVGCAVNDNPDGACTANIDDPSGLARINAWVDSATTNNTALAVYGGDLKGNLWRFQLDDVPAVARGTVTRLATVENDSHQAQPITVKPELATVKNNRVVFIGTGKFLGSSDKPDLQKQSIYAIKDPMSGVISPIWNMTRTGPGAITGFKKQVLTEDGSGATRTIASPQAVNLTSDNGWFIDLPDGGTGDESAERVNVDPIAQLGTLVVPSNVPSVETCLAGGSGWQNYLDISTGALVPAISGTNPASVKVAGSLIVGINIIKIGDQIKTIVTTADNQQLTQDAPVAAQGVQGRRVSWRELIVE